MIGLIFVLIPVLVWCFGQIMDAADKADREVEQTAKRFNEIYRRNPK